MNKVYLVGRLSTPVEMRSTPSGIMVATFSLAVTKRTTTGNQAEFLDIVAWRGLAENCGKYLEKGQRAAVSGSIQTRSYDDKNGIKRYKTEIIADEVEFLSKKASATNGEQETELSEADIPFLPFS